jgi:hypothetical protein
MKKLLISATVVAGLFAAPTVDSLQKQINDLQKQLKELKAEQTAQDSRYYKKVAPIVTNSHLFWSYDLRTSYDAISKETTAGILYNVDPMTMVVSPIGMQEGTKNHTGQVLSNRVILTGVYKPSDALKATVKIEANKVFGMNSINQMSNPFQNVDWVANETPDDGTIRLKSAWFNWYFDDFMFSAGRRPATNGFPANLREEDLANSPLAHLINMEFDGFSFEVGNGIFSKMSNLFSDWGTWMKFCLGRGYSDTNGKWSLTNTQPDYTKNYDTPHADFGGFLLIPYDDGQYSLKTETVWAFNLQGFRMEIPNSMYAQIHGLSAMQLAGLMQQYGMNDFNASMPILGNYFGENVIFEANGIGNDNFGSDAVNNFLDNTVAFVSYAFSQTRPKNGQRMLGSTDKKSGHSIWVGADMPGFRANDRLGFNFVHGSKYWRNFTYGEDTLAGSIASVRGNAYEVYYNAQIIPHLTAGLRYTYFKYNYPGSDSFFGDMGDPEFKAFSYVDKATDIRAYIRYRF